MISNIESSLSEKNCTGPLSLFCNQKPVTVNAASPDDDVRPGETMNDLLSPDALWITTFFFATAATLIIAVRFLEKRW
ncbi:hypothetical protein AFK67_08310 [Cronobacter dublinensis subsp. dublinensis LMG 23823]|nr:hypothetical protein AFK67_08310 [Cronobacter dublinensis subsp. dublinensis LMG 23823]